MPGILREKPRELHLREKQQVAARGGVAEGERFFQVFVHASVMDICAMASFIHALLSCVLHGQAQHVRPRIVAAHVELHAARGHAMHIKVGIEDVLPIPHRLHDIVPVGVDDAAAAAAGDIAQGAASSSGQCSPAG